MEEETVLIFLGVIMFLLIILGAVAGLTGAVLVAAMFYCGCGSIVVGLIVRALYRNYWK
jgi:hypothetical protein